MKFGIYSLLGAGVFKFDPKAYYKGSWYRLQPLGTEGQLVYEGMKKYNLTEACIPFGGGIYVLFNKTIRISLETVYRKTFTDYLDDIKGSYADADLVGSHGGTIAAALSNRSGEITSDPAELIYSATGQKRGDPTHKDGYIFTMVKLSYLMKK
jgi:hypothetical protein